MVNTPEMGPRPFLPEKQGQRLKLIDALELVRRPASDGAGNLRVSLACGFTPLHLETFLAAQLRKRFPERRIEIRTGLFGDLIGNIQRFDPSGVDSVAVVIEWADLDPRLGIRSLGGWRPTILPEIAESANHAANRLSEALKEVSRLASTVVCLPTLSLPPMFSTRPEQMGLVETQLRAIVASLAASLSLEPRIRIVNVQLLDQISPPAGRLDVKSEAASGFPYSLPHASALGELLGSLVHNQVPQKGLITDLDDTLWDGILGEDGVDGISWHLDRQSHMHGLYQQFVASLAGAGVLVGIASKNDPDTVARAFERKDLLITKNDIYPFEVHWSRKSDSVRRILNTWNVGADSVVFIDDSPMEIAEVKAAFPEMECIVFPKGDYQVIWDLLKHLRCIFGKPFLTDDDALRLQSIRNASAWRQDGGSRSTSADDFLKAAGASVVFEYSRQGADVRAFDLVNKTNQFNLNGKRFSESEWLSFFSDPTAFLLAVSYEDKYGPLGKIAVLIGKMDDRKICLSSWVLSCRAFSRRIEHQCLKYLFEKLGAHEIVFDYKATPRNGPLQEFFAELLGVSPVAGVGLSSEQFAASVPPLFHRVEDAIQAFRSESSPLPL